MKAVSILKRISYFFCVCAFLLSALAAVDIFAFEGSSAEQQGPPEYLAGGDEEFSVLLAAADLNLDDSLSRKELLYAYYFTDSGVDQKIGQLWLNFHLLNDVSTDLISRENYLSRFDFHLASETILLPNTHLEDTLWKAAEGEHLVSSLLFPRGLDSINPGSVKQRGIGDCQAIASIASLSSTRTGKKKILSYFDPRFQPYISSLFGSRTLFTLDDFLTDRQRFETADNSGSFHSVTSGFWWVISQLGSWRDFHKYGEVVVTLPGAIEPVSLNLDELLYQRKQYATAGGDGLWLAVLEKAIALATQDLDSSKVYSEYSRGTWIKKLELYRAYGAYRFLDGINYGSVFFLLTGNPSVEFKRNELDREQLHDLLSSYNRSGRIIVAKLSYDIQDFLPEAIQSIHPSLIQDLLPDEVQNPYSELYNDHVYAVTAYDKDSRYVFLREPNGTREPVKPGTKEALDGTTDGHFVLPLEEFHKLFTHFGFVEL